MICTVWKVEEFLNKIESTESLISSSSVGTNRDSFLSAIKEEQQGLFKVDIDARPTEATQTGVKLTTIYRNGSPSKGTIDGRDIVQFYSYNTNWGTNPNNSNDVGYNTTGNPFNKGATTAVLRYSAHEAYGMHNINKPTLNPNKHVYVRVLYENNLVKAVNSYTTMSEAFANWPTVDSNQTVDIFDYKYEFNLPENYPQMALPFTTFDWTEQSGAAANNDLFYNWTWDSTTIMRIKFSFSPVRPPDDMFYDGEAYLTWYDSNHMSNNGMSYVTLDQFYPQYFSFRFRMIASSSWAKFVPQIYSRI